jgi:gamma-glutamylcyclotransferase (GGCT)/AIG2-like uncharacterized protein YtfP
METLFSYGTLQTEATQVATFGRTLSGERDALPGYRLVTIEVDNPDFVALSGSATHRNVEHTGRESDRVSGMRLQVTREELAKSDAYEEGADYERVRVVLESGSEAWVYVYVTPR